MSRTYELVCHECKKALWVGQSNSRGEYIYTSPEHLHALRNFLFAHKNHRLEFGDDEFFDASRSTETWFLLYDGSSEDGMGPGRYCRRTTDKQEAIAHSQKCIRSPYSTGYVLIVKDDSAEKAWEGTDWSKV